MEKLEDLTDKVEDGLSSLSKYVKFGSALGGFIAIAETVSIANSHRPGRRRHGGDGRAVAARKRRGGVREGIFNYKPNLQWRGRICGFMGIFTWTRAITRCFTRRRSIWTSCNSK